MTPYGGSGEDLRIDGRNHTTRGFQRMSDPDDRLRQKLRSKAGLEQKADDGNDSSTAQEGDYGDDEDEDDDDDDTEMEMSEEMQEAVQLIAEAADDDVSPAQVEEMLQPLFGEDTTDDDTEMAGDADTEADTDTESEADGGDGGDEPTVDREEIVAEARDAAATAATEAVDEALPDEGVVTEDDLDAKLDDVVDALADETKDVLQKANVGETPTPTATGDSTVTKDDLFSDSDAGGDATATGGSE